ncbi:MAG: hypothetical protein F6K19_15360 [Cyanothece sp. SIO1E1]|nr:hypothetical protein [Cyanothece sp. SIO1E1]
MSHLENYQAYIDIAINILQAQDPDAIAALKDFLIALPTPQQIEQVLAAAIQQLAERAPHACLWLIQHRTYLEPELDLVASVKELALSKLITQGFASGQDFRFASEHQLWLSSKALTGLLAASSKGDCLLMEEILEIQI